MKTEERRVWDHGLRVRMLYRSTAKRTATLQSTIVFTVTEEEKRIKTEITEGTRSHSLQRRNRVKKSEKVDSCSHVNNMTLTLFSLL